MRELTRLERDAAALANAELRNEWRTQRQQSVVDELTNRLGDTGCYCEHDGIGCDPDSDVPPERWCVNCLAGEVLKANTERREAGLKIREKWDRRLWSILNHGGAVEPYITRKEAQDWMSDIDALLGGTKR